MFKDRTITTLVAFIAAIFYFHANATSTDSEEFESVPGEYLVKLKAEMLETIQLADSQSSLSQLLGASVVGIIPEQSIVVVKRASFEMTSSAVEVLASNPLVEIVEPNYIYHLSNLPNDPFLVNTWGLSNQVAGGVDINMKPAWMLTTGEESPLVAVIDTGIDLDHPDLVDNLWVNEAEAKGQVGVDDDGNGVVDDIHGYNAIDNNGNPDDGYNHGSHCAGTIGAKGNNAIGVVGVNWTSKMMPIKIFSNSGQTNMAAIIRGIEYAIKMNVKVMNNSWGGGAFSQLLFDTIKKTHENNSIFVVAAGNNSNNNDSRPTYPANYDSPNIISVAAIDSRGQLASFSNYGKKSVHLGAPGVRIYSTIRNGNYEYNSGTSMAAPHVTGVAALLWSYEPELSNVEVVERILKNTKPMGSMSTTTSSGGILDAHAVLTN